MEVTPFYDPMIAKIVAHGASRVEALDRLASALDGTLIAGPRTNAAFLAALCRAEAFRAGAFDTGFIDRNLAALGAVAQLPDLAAAAAALGHLVDQQQQRLMTRASGLEGVPNSPWARMDAFSLAGPQPIPWPVLVDGERMTARVSFGASAPKASIDSVAAARDTRLVVAGPVIYAIRRGRQTIVQIDHGDADIEHGGGDGTIRAPMHGKLLALLVSKGTQVEKGSRVAVMEAMKMEHTLTAPVGGIVTELAAAVGQQIAEGATVMVVEPQNDAA
jgi:3-methylcrotonyl-CoA carboxylase alpha subunit